jgi:hypothetical protein
MKYVHLSGNEDLGYCLKEQTLEYNERKILYLLSELNEDDFKFACDIDMVVSNIRVTRKDTRTAFIKGYVVKWKYERDEKGLDVSELEPIDSKEQEAITHLLQSSSDAKIISFS